MLSAAIITITRRSTPMSVLTSASERLGRAASGSFLRSITGGCGFFGCCDCASDCLGCCADLFEVCGWGSCAATPRTTAISSGRVVKTILFIFESFSERRRGAAPLRARRRIADVCFNWIAVGDYSLSVRACRVALFVAQGFDRVEARGLPRGPQAEADAQPHRNDETDDRRPQRHEGRHKHLDV